MQQARKSASGSAGDVYFDFYRQRCESLLRRHARSPRPSSPFQSADDPGRPAASLSLLQSRRRQGRHHEEDDDEDEDEQFEDMDAADHSPGGRTAKGLTDHGDGHGDGDGPFIRENSEAVYEGR